tara:strand:+ start:426 stop:1100 length:675 start_codon:yes stop_codon:yes gene_type:complete
MNKINHVAFIMDGNGRWGKKRRKGRNFGHYIGVQTLKKTVESAIKLKIPTLTFYVFSTENWKRPKKEINFLLKLIRDYFIKELNNVINQGIKIKILGNKNKLPLKLVRTLRLTEKKTIKNKKINVNLAINYGSKSEIISSFKKIKKNDFINEGQVSRNLSTKNFPDPDILIRTGGKKRLSNFMLWQLAYTEIFFLDKLWPDFNNQDLKRVLIKFKNIKRNFGNI